ncbi:porin [Alcanivorax quisquiliarum]|uniref:Porin n=1 Tax=Alcanivorax quisquiliarum TaxID=2933565 RepID=A0ABT0E774_9GAMM|nr:porin [Alcanivorax quisquiliarum]MCK0537688.1 porin [Alcanivorax quisquiliarum]
MNKKLLAMAVGAAVLLPGVALADISIYGRAHLSLDQLDDGNDYNELNLSSNSSRLGFRGETKLGSGDLTAFFQIEQEINFAQGKGNEWAGRDTFAGLKGDFGRVRAGQFDSPFKRARGPANLFGDQLGDMRNLTRVDDARFDERMPNTIEYQTPDMNGFKATLGYSIHEGQNHVDDTKGEGVSLSLAYAQGAFEGELAYEGYGEDHGRGEREAVRAAAAYKLGDFKVVGFYQTSDYTDDADPVLEDELTADVWGLGGEFKATEKTYLRAMWLSRDADADDSKTDMITVGVEHRLDRAFRIYANYAVVMNDTNTNLTPWNQARTTSTAGTQDEDASGFSLGARYDF